MVEIPTLGRYISPSLGGGNGRAVLPCLQGFASLGSQQTLYDHLEAIVKVTFKKGLDSFSIFSSVA